MEALQMRPNAANIPPRNVSDAAARFACSPMGQTTGQRCVELYRDGERRRTPCSGCAAGKARARLMGGRPVQVVEVPEVAEVAELRAAVAKMGAELERLKVRTLRVELDHDDLKTRLAEPKQVGVRLTSLGFWTTPEQMKPWREWCRAHDWSLSRLARAAIREAARDIGVDLPDYGSGCSRGFLGASSYRVAKLKVPAEWSDFLDGLTAERKLSPFCCAAIEKYLEAHP